VLLSLSSIVKFSNAYPSTGSGHASDEYIVGCDYLKVLKKNIFSANADLKVVLNNKRDRRWK